MLSIEWDAKADCDAEMFLYTYYNSFDTETTTFVAERVVN